MDKPICIEVKMKVIDMYRFFLYHAYHGFAPVPGLVISLGALALLLCGVAETAFAKAMLIILALLFTVVNPIQLYLKAARQVTMTPGFQKPLCYELTEEKVTVSQEQEEIAIEWKDFVKAVVKKNAIYLYTSAVHASILPREACGGEWERISALVREKVG